MSSTYISCNSCKKNIFSPCSILVAAKEKSAMISERGFACPLFESEYYNGIKKDNQIFKVQLYSL